MGEKTLTHPVISEVPVGISTSARVSSYVAAGLSPETGLKRKMRIATFPAVFV